MVVIISRYDALATQLCPVTIHWSSSMVLQACVTYFSTPIIVPAVCFLLRTAVKMAITVLEELYEYMDLGALGCRYEDEHPGVFIGSDYVCYPAEEQDFTMEMQ